MNERYTASIMEKLLRVLAPIINKRYTVDFVALLYYDIDANSFKGGR